MLGTDHDPFGRVRAWFAHWPPAWLAVAALSIAAVARAALDEVWSDQFVFLPFFPAILLCAMVAGWRYGAIATVVAAVLAVLQTSRPIELSPQSSYIRKLQHELAEQHSLTSRSTGKEPYRRVRISKAD